MKHYLSSLVFATSCLISPFAFADTKHSAEVASLTITSDSMDDGKKMSEKLAYCTLEGKNKTKKASNKSPHLAWSGAPAGTKSFAIVAVDPDVPAKFDDANVVGKVIPADFPRQEFYHWVMTDIAADKTELAENEGKNSDNGVLMINDYAVFMQDRPAQEFIGYDGPCPPFNDARTHNYHFTVYALNVPTLGKKEMTNGRDVIKDIEKHAIAKGKIVGTFSNFAK